MDKLVISHSISVAGSVKSLDQGESLTFPTSILENTIRATCTRIKKATGMVFTVNRRKNGTHLVTRIS